MTSPLCLIPSGAVWVVQMQCSVQSLSDTALLCVLCESRPTFPSILLPASQQRGNPPNPPRPLRPTTHVLAIDLSPQQAPGSPSLVRDPLPSSLPSLSHLPCPPLLPAHLGSSPDRAGRTSSPDNVVARAERPRAPSWSRQVSRFCPCSLPLTPLLPPPFPSPPLPPEGREDRTISTPHL